ncbi:hypothetical protein D3OALGA1CA_1695 [Olavius algarvensis associated proteobacterium Delta 3]|nr:hypothetical protein D3OALGA1CA_1695 [Olavius algarvensis associated proteobacterium Delta 3]CAB5112551.1 hypothetical protein D3OALGB2SA_2492 [Olavius algarvensis associated proteobacterium Delta 3]
MQHVIAFNDPSGRLSDFLYISCNDWNGSFKKQKGISKNDIFDIEISDLR